MDWINEIIIGLIEMYGTNNPYDLCNMLEIEIIKVNKDFKLLGDNHSSYIRRMDDNEVIFISNDLSESYEKFYLSHELGHAILHTKIKNSFNKFLLNKGKLEKQANYFAFKLGKITIDEVDLYEMTLEQICCSLELPYDVVNQLVNL